MGKSIDSSSLCAQWCTHLRRTQPGAFNVFPIPGGEWYVLAVLDPDDEWEDELDEDKPIVSVHSRSQVEQAIKILSSRADNKAGS